MRSNEKNLLKDPAFAWAKENALSLPFSVTKANLPDDIDSNTTLFSGHASKPTFDAFLRFEHLTLHTLKLITR